MSLSHRMETLTAAVETGVIPLFSCNNADRATRITGALRDGGARVIEFTDRDPSAWRVFSELSSRLARHDPGAILGAGSIRDAQAADRFIAVGARFIVGPTFSPEVARLCNRRRIPYVPGCATPTEVVAAEESGVELVKIFPGDSLGPAFLRAIRGPMPDVQVVVTGGVAATLDGVRQWIAAGAACLGFGSGLVTRRHVEGAPDADPADLGPAVARLISYVAETRGTGPGRHRPTEQDTSS